MAFSTTAPTSAPRFTGLAAAGSLIAEDLVSTLAYAAAYAATHDLRVSMALGIGVGLAAIAWRRARARPVDAMQWMSLGLVVVFGALSLGLHDPRFIMLKPTLAYVALTAVMLKPGWMARYMPEPVRVHGLDLVRGFERVWAGAMLAIAGANLALAVLGDVAAWAAFFAIAPLASKVGLVAVQYAALRITVRRRIRRSGPEAPGPTGFAAAARPNSAAVPESS